MEDTQETMGYDLQVISFYRLKLTKTLKVNAHVFKVQIR